MGTNMRHWHKDDYSYVETEEYKTYRRAYLRFLRSEAAEHIDAFSNLDVIHNAELTYKNQMWFEARGIRPLPVWHCGSDTSWLQRYIKEGYDYICIGGLVPNTIYTLKPALDRLWSEELTDSKGMPLVKTHGFGLTSFHLLYRYPWYSVDSKSWSDYARFGLILVPPRKLNAEWDWQHPIPIFVSNRNHQKRMDNKHLRTMPASSRKQVHRLLEEIGVALGTSEYHKEMEGYELQDGETWAHKSKRGHKGEVEKVLTKGVTNDFTLRMEVNMYVFKMIERSIPEWPWSIRDTIGRQGRRGTLIS